MYGEEGAGECVGWRESGSGRCFSLPQALESVQSLQEAQLRLSELEKQVLAAQQALQDKTEESEKETQILRR